MDMNILVEKKNGERIQSKIRRSRYIPHPSIAISKCKYFSRKPKGYDSLQ